MAAVVLLVVRPQQALPDLVEAEAVVVRAPKTLFMRIYLVRPKRSRLELAEQVEHLFLQTAPTEMRASMEEILALEIG